MKRRLASLQLWERVVQAFCWTFIATYSGDVPTGSGGHLVDQLANLGSPQRASLSIIVGAIQLVLGAFVAPHVGDPGTLDLIPRALLRRFGDPDGPLGITLNDVIAAAVKAVQAKNPNVELTAEDIAHEIAAKYGERPPDTSLRR